MKTMLAGLVAIGLCLPAAAAQPNVDPMLRSMSLMFLIADKCPDFYLVDVKKAKAAGMAFLEIAGEMVGEEAARSLAHTELARRFEEAELTGFQQWCGYQRDRQITREFFPRRR